MISVVIPVYNGEKFLAETYETLCGSEEKDLELLFVNDGSTDKSAELIKEFQKKDSRVKYFEKENGGIASSRNYGLQHAEGEYVCFLDQDDFVKTDMFSLMLEDIRETNADFVQAATNRIVNGIEEPACMEQGQTVIEKGQQLYDFYLQTLVMRGVTPHPECKVNGSIWSCLFRTEFLKKNHITFYKYCDYEDDWIFCILAYRAAEKICLERKTVYSWRVHNQSESHNRVVKDRYLTHFYENYCEMRKFFLDAVNSTQIEQTDLRRYQCELQKMALLWSLSNETGRGIAGRTEKESIAVMRHVVQEEKRNGIYPEINQNTLSITGYGMTGLKYKYHVFRDKFLTFLLLHHMIPAAVWLNKKVLHGRWHV